MSIELPEIATPISITPTIRITDDGGPSLPIALAGSTQTMVRISAFVIAPSGATVPGTRELGGNDLQWGASSSNFSGRRASLLAAGDGGLWLRESASHDALWNGLLRDGAEEITSVTTGYFGIGSACIERARHDAAQVGLVGRVSAPGAVVAAGSCIPSSGAVDASNLTCGQFIDLALAMSGSSPRSSVVRRFSGLVPQSVIGSDVAIATGGSTNEPVLSASTYASCTPVGTAVPTGGTAVTSPSDGPSSEEVAVAASACGGGTSTLIAADDTTDASSETLHGL